MKRRRASVASIVLLGVAMIAACDARYSPFFPYPSQPPYDLLYSTLASRTVLIQPLAGGPPRSLGLGIMEGTDPVASHEGRYVAYSRLSDNGGASITVLDRVTGISTDATNGVEFDESPAFSPDGSRILFVSHRDVYSNIYVMNRDGTGLRQLTTEPLPAVIEDRSPAWSADGRQIAWTSNMGGLVAIWIMNTDGSNKHRLTNTTQMFEDDAAWSPDGTRLVYFEVKDVTPKLVIVNADGSNRLVMQNPANGYGRDPAWSPDGKLLAFTFNPDDHSRPQIYTMNADGTDMQRRLFDDLNRGVRRASFIRR